MKRCMMTDGYYAVYKGNVFNLIIGEFDELFICTNDESIIDETFEVIDTEFRKKVKLKNISEAYELRTTYKYGNNVFYLSGKDQDGKELITTTDRAIAEKDGFEFIEPGVYQKRVDISELEEIKQDRISILYKLKARRNHMTWLKRQLKTFKGRQK